MWNHWLGYWKTQHQTFCLISFESLCKFNMHINLTCTHKEWLNVSVMWTCLRDQVYSVPFHFHVQVRTVSPAAAVRRSVTLSSVRVTWPCASATPTSAWPAELQTAGTASRFPARTAASREDSKRYRFSSGKKSPQAKDEKVFSVNICVTHS